MDEAGRMRYRRWHTDYPVVLPARETAYYCHARELELERLDGAYCVRQQH